jgi:tetratricopeptide (TPR) repeat protein
MRRVYAVFTLWACCLASQVQSEQVLRAEDPSLQPPALLAEAMALSKQRADHGDQRVVSHLRLGATLRMAGLTQEAAAVLQECSALNEKDSDPDLSREEVKTELAQEYYRLGQKDRARELLAELTSREFDLVGPAVLSRTALELGDNAESEQIVRSALSLAQKPNRKLTLMGHAALCALARIALELNKPELAEQCEVAVKDQVWKSAIAGHRAAALAESGRSDEALRLAAEISDLHLAVLAYARIAAVQYAKKSPHEQTVAALQKMAGKLKIVEERDFALRIAAGKLAAGGDRQSPRGMAAGIHDPSTRLLACCTALDAPSFDSLLALLKECPTESQPALAEVLAVGCGRAGLVPQLLTAASRTAPGWPRVRTLCEAARKLPKSASPQNAALVLQAGRDELPHVSDSGWRVHVQVQLALAAHALGDAAATDEFLQGACGEALQLESSEDLRTALPPAVEAALWCGRKELAARSLTQALQRPPETALRNVLVPMLVDAGQADAALAEMASSSLKDDYAGRFVVYRLAKAGKVSEAVQLAHKLSLRAQTEALADVALTQLKRPTPASGRPRKAGLSLHGVWFYWTGQLEHLGIDWEIMPFSLPYLEGAEGIAARYAMLGYPGAGDHHLQASAAGEEHLRDYLRGGGGMFGICAGQLFATGHPTGHQFLPSDFYYMRGEGPHQVQTASQHPAAAGLPPVVIINRRNGDFLLPRPGCDVLGWYDKEHVCAAVATAYYGLGRVAVSSPHPEGGRGLEPKDRVFIALTLWAMEGTP